MKNNPLISRRNGFRYISAAILIFFLFGVTTSVEALATTRYVASTGVDSGNCSSSASPCRTIQYAANQSASGDMILVAQGTYTYNAGADTQCSFLQTKAVVCIVDKRLTILGGYSTSNWSIANPSVNLTVIDGLNSHRGVAVIGFNTTTTYLDMEGFTIQNGRAQGPTYLNPYLPGGMGGGMWAAKASVTLKDMIYKNNQAIGANTASGAGGSADGSGLRIESSPAGASSLLQRVTFDGNQSFGGVGPERGGFAFGALYVFGSVVTVEDATFTNNLAQAGSSTGSGTSGGLQADALGGAIGLGQSAAVLNRIVVTNNQAIGGNAVTTGGGAFGGGIYSEDSFSVSISDSYISNNMSRGGNAVTGGFGAGGGVLIFNSPVTIERVKLIANSAIGGNTTGGGNAGPGGGGGLYLWKSKSVNANASITNAIITDNYVTMGTGLTSLGGGGGGIQVQGVTATISHTTIARNRLGPALISGQGLLVLASPLVSSSTANVNHSIISNHTEGGAGAVAVLVQSGNTVNFNRGLFAGNTRNTNAGDSTAGTINGLSSMLLETSAGFIAPGSPNYNYHLRLDSAAKDQATGSAIAVDFDGQIRPYNSVSDLGAFEYWPFTLNAFRGNGTVQLSWTTGAGLLTGGLSNYEVVVTCAAGASAPTQGGCGLPINAGTSTTFTLTGLTNFKLYTIVVNARGSSNALIATSTTVSATPTDALTNGMDTTGVFRPGNGLLYLKNSNTTGFADVAINYGTAGDYPISGDWDGNGTATIGIYRNGSFYLRNSNTLGFADIVFAFGTPGDKPVAGDWDGDGVDTIGVYSNGQFLLRNSNSAGAATMSFFLGNPGDIGIAGDWNGDGMDTTGVFRPGNGVIFLKNANTTGFADIALNYGLGGDLPVTGDWNNDGIDTIGVYRNAQFLLRNSNTIGFAEIVFGLGNPGDMPIAGNWDGSIP